MSKKTRVTVSEGLILNQIPKQCYKLAYYLKPVATNYDKTQQQQQHHVPQTFIPQNTPSKNSAFRKVHLPVETSSCISWAMGNKQM